VKYESKKLKNRIGIALTAAAVTALPMTAFAAEDTAMDSYDLDTVEVVGQRPVSQPVETVEEPAEETPNATLLAYRRRRRRPAPPPGPPQHPLVESARHRSL